MQIGLNLEELSVEHHETEQTVRNSLILHVVILVQKHEDLRSQELYLLRTGVVQ